VLSVIIIVIFVLLVSATWLARKTGFFAPVMWFAGKVVPKMAYNVLSGRFNPASLYLYMYLSIPCLSSWWCYLSIDVVDGIFCALFAACWLTSVQYHSLNWSLVFIEHMSTRWCSAVVLLLFILWTESDTYIIIDGSPSIYKGLDTCYSATYMSQTRDQQRFTMSEVAAHRLEPMVPQRIMWPSIARANGQLDPRCS